MSDRVLLTEKREAVLNGTYDGDDAALRNQKSRLRASARTTLDELITIAASPNIDNAEVFDPEQIMTLLSTLLAGSGGVIPSDDGDVADAALAWEPDPDYRNAIYVATERAQLNVERQSEPSDIYELFGERAETLRNHHNEDHENND